MLTLKENVIRDELRDESIGYIEYNKKHERVTINLNDDSITHSELLDLIEILQSVESKIEE